MNWALLVFIGIVVLLALIPSAADRERARFYESVLQKLDEDLKERQ